VDLLEDRKMALLTNMTRCVFKFGVVLAGALVLGANLGFAASPPSETIQATYAQAGGTTGVTLIIYNYSTASDLRILSLAFGEGMDRGLATALSKTNAVGRCSIAGALSYDVAFIQMVLTPTGRRITFVTSRPHLFDEADPPGSPPPFDLAVGQFDLNDADPAKNTGFLYPASKLVIDKQGEFHYDLGGNPWALVNVLDLPGITA
jgi:hypothetical protein